MISTGFVQIKMSRVFNLVLQFHYLRSCFLIFVFFINLFRVRITFPTLRRNPCVECRGQILSIKPVCAKIYKRIIIPILPKKYLNSRHTINIWVITTTKNQPKFRSVLNQASKLKTNILFYTN